jgi:hypothetical protein
MVNPNGFYTYAYLREDRTPYYIGKGKSNRAYCRSKKCIKPPKDKLRILILKQNLTEEEAFGHEKYMIAVFGRKDLGTGILHNKTDGGEGSSNPSVETRKKMSESKIGSIPWNKEKKNCHSEETRRKISEAHKGKIHSKEHRAKIKKATKGQTRSEEFKLKMSQALKGENNPMYNKTHSEETKRKLSEAQSGDKNGNSKKWKIKFNNFEEKIISCLLPWAKENGYNPCCLYDISNKRQKTHKDIISVELLTI